MIAAATEAVTLEAAKERIRVSGTQSDAEISGMIAAAVERVEHEVGCSIIERVRKERMLPVSKMAPIRLSYRGLLLLPEIAEDTTADPPVQARPAVNVIIRWYADGDDESAAPARSMALTSTARVEFTESGSPASIEEPLRYGHAWLYPPSSGWPDREGEFLELEYRTGAPSPESIPQTWKDAVLEMVRVQWDGDMGTNADAPAMRLLSRWRRFN